MCMCKAFCIHGWLYTSIMMITIQRSMKHRILCIVKAMCLPFLSMKVTVFKIAHLTPPSDLFQ